MSFAISPRALRIVFALDAASCGVLAVLQWTAGATLSRWLGLPGPLLVESGFVLVCAAALAAWLATCDPVPRYSAWLLVAGNAAWVVGCVVLLVQGSASTTLGQAYLGVQAIAVAALAGLEWLGIRRVPSHAWT